jgi:hypothetical protein
MSVSCAARARVAGRTSLSMTFTVRRAPGDVPAAGNATYVCVSAAGPVALPNHPARSHGTSRVPLRFP